MTHPRFNDATIQPAATGVRKFWASLPTHREAQLQGRLLRAVELLTEIHDEACLTSEQLGRIREFLAS